MSLLQTEKVEAGYGDFQALFGVSLAIQQSETVAIIGANGSGKSTLLRTICGLLRSRQPSDVRFEGAPIGSLDPEQIVTLGIAMVPEGRRAFPSLSVEDNLRMGAYCGRKGPWTLDRVYALFPNLAERRFAASPTLSGGQQQTLAIGRALMTNPNFCSATSSALVSPRSSFATSMRLCQAFGPKEATILIVEQDIQRALRAADRVYCMQKGRVTLEGRPGSLSRDEIKSAYFGI